MMYVFQPGDWYMYHAAEGDRPRQLQKIYKARKPKSETNSNHGTTLLQCGEQDIEPSKSLLGRCTTAPVRIKNS
jgi:hypothetical protein